MTILSFGLAAKSAFKRFLDAYIESRMRRAMEELKRHEHLLPRDFERAGWRITERSEDSLPFVR